MSVFGDLGKKIQGSDKLTIASILLILIVILVFVGTATGFFGWLTNITLGSINILYDVNSKVRSDLGLTEQTATTTTVISSGTNTTVTLKQINDDSVVGEASKTVTPLLSMLLKLVLDPRTLIIVLFISIFVYVLVTEKI